MPSNRRVRAARTRRLIELLEQRAMFAADYGLAAMAQFARLPYLTTDHIAGGQSSRDRSGGNNDWGNDLRIEGSGTHVVLDQNGPGQVNRIWATGVTDAVRIRMYFDNESIPRVDLRLVDLVGGSDPRFPAPLVGSPDVSSGGFVSYVPLPYASHLKITLSGADNLYYNIGYDTFPAGSAITTWTGSEDASTVIKQWNAVGSDPKSTAGTTVSTGTIDVGANNATTVLDLTGQREIESIQLSLPGFAVPTPQVATDDGRAHKGTSTFTLALPGGSAPVTLRRRLDYGIGNQKANVYVDNVLVGQWFDAGNDNADHWRDSSFAIPLEQTRGKTSIRVRIEFVSADIDWNEFRYQAVVNGTVTDTLDVGNAASEQSHAYAITQQSWTGTRTFTYPIDPSTTSEALLNGTRLRITWDGQSTPAVDAPIGSFFGMGQFGAAAIQSLPVGVGDDGRLYCYFPMPFRRSAKIELVNDQKVPLTGVGFEVQHKAFTGSFADVGYFRTQFRANTPAILGSDAVILDTSGSGKFVGVTNSMAGQPDANASRWFLEGDERIYLDGSATPAIQGTGTEDFFDAAWYFQFGQYSRPLSGQPAHRIVTAGNGLFSDETSAYRFFLQNAVPFHSGIRVSIEHGATNDTANDLSTLAYYYQSPAPRATVTDMLDVDNAASETSHGYTVTGQTWAGLQTFSYEGDHDDVTVSDYGRAFNGSSAFTLAVDSSNVGVILRRRLDQGIADQRADVYVDGQRVGEWYTAGENGTHRWADADFQLPASLTSGKSSIRVEIRFISSEADWNEFKYQALSLLPPDSTPPTVTASTFDFESQQAVHSHFSEPLGGAITSDQVRVLNRTTGQTLPADAYTVVWSGGPNNVSVRFTAPLPDGDYRLTYLAGGASDSAGNALASDSPPFDFFVLAGDVNRDRTVDFADLLVLAKNYGQSGKTFTQGNVDYSANGLVGFDDLLILAKRYNATLVPPAPAFVSTIAPATRRRIAAANVMT